MTQTPDRRAHTPSSSAPASINVTPARPLHRAAAKTTTMALGMALVSASAFGYSAATGANVAAVTSPLAQRQATFSAEYLRKHRPTLSPSPTATTAVPAATGDSKTPTPTPTSPKPTTTTSAAPKPTTTTSAAPTPTVSAAPTPTPTPTPTVVPSASSFPDATTTGWRHTGVVLKPSGGMTITAAGTVIDGLDISGGVNVKANNVTISRSRITAGTWYPVRVFPGVTGFRLVDTEVSGINNVSVYCTVAVTGDDVTLTRVDLHDCADGFHPGSNSTIQDSYIHNLWLGTNASGVQVVATHNDGIQIMNGSNFTILHNRIDIGHTQNAAVFVKADFGTISNVSIVNNYLDGGCYTIFGGDTTSYKVTNVAITNNTLGLSYVYGLMLTSRMTGPVVSTGNVTVGG